MMCLQVLIFLTWGIFAGEAAVEAFEHVGEGYCAVREDCGVGCRSSYFWRITDSAHYSTNLEGCAADALQAGAQGFFVNSYGSRCFLVPKQDPGMSNGANCPSTSTCPAPSPYGNCNLEQDYWYDYESKGDWEWRVRGGVAPILGVYPSSSYSCYRLKESPTEDPTENPIEVPTENPTEVTDTPTDPVTDAPTDPVTDAPTDPVTDASTDPVTDVPTDPGTNCVFLLNTENDNELECFDGTVCDGVKDGWDCCSSHGNRAKCPPNFPIMCSDPGCCSGGTSYCCAESSADCETYGCGGSRVCSDGQAASRCDDHNDKNTCIDVDKCQWRRDTTTRTKSCFLKECRAFRNPKKCTRSDVGEELGCEWKGKRCQAPGEESECDFGNKRDCREQDHCEWRRKDCRVKVVLTPGCGQYDTNASCKRRDNWPSNMNADTVCEWGNGVCTETEEVGCPAFKTQYECLRPLGVLLRCKWSRNRNNRGCRRQ